MGSTQFTQERTRPKRARFIRAFFYHRFIPYSLLPPRPNFATVIPHPMSGTLGTASVTKERLLRREKVLLDSSWWLSFPTLRALWEKKLQPLLSHPASASDSNFRLLDVLAELSEVLAADPQLTPESLLQDHSPRFRQLKELLIVQLQAAVKEQLKLPHHQDANELDLAHYALGGELRLTHRNYPQKDLIERSDLAAEKSTGEIARRYRRESNQLRRLYKTKLLPELQALDAQHWIQGSAAQIAPDIRNAYGLKTDETTLFGQRHAFSMPTNKIVYAEGMSYINVFQLAYLPERQLMLVLTDQWYSELSLEQHRQVLREWENQVLPSKRDLTESVIMQTIVTLPEELKHHSLFEIFQNLSIQYGKRTLSKDGKTDYAALQQRGLGKVALQQQSIEQAATFLTQVLLTEYLVCLDHPEALAGLGVRLRDAFEFVAHPLFGGRPFAYKTTKESYFRTHLNTWLKAQSAHNTSPEVLATKLRNLQTQVIQHGVQRSHDDKVRRNEILQSIAKTDSHILTKLISQAQCASGSLGGIETLMSSPATASLTNSVMSGHLATHGELTSLIGAERASLWHHGVCVNPHCHHAGKTQLVGECSLCLQCELLANMNQLPGRTSTENEDFSSASQLANHTFANTRAAREFFSSLMVGIDELPSHFLAPESLLKQVR